MPTTAATMEARVREVLETRKIFPVAGTADAYVVTNAAGDAVYYVDLTRCSCTCRDYAVRRRWNGGECKHIAACRAWETEQRRKEPAVCGWCGCFKPDDGEVLCESCRKARAEILAQLRGVGY